MIKFMRAKMRSATLCTGATRAADSEKFVFPVYADLRITMTLKLHGQIWCYIASNLPTKGV